MVDFISSRPKEGIVSASPEEAAAAYEQTPSSVSFGEKIGAAWEFGIPRALERLGHLPGLAGRAQFAEGGLDYEQEQAELERQKAEPMLQPEEYNAKYAAPGKSIGTTPLPESVAKDIGDDQVRDATAASVLQRSSWPTQLGAGLIAQLMDPISDAALLIPGLGEGAILAKLGMGTGFAARTAARAISGVTFGAAAQAPISAARYGLSALEDGDYTLRDAFYDTAFLGPLQGALGVVGLGALHDAWLLGRGVSPEVETAMHLMMADTATTRAALQTTLAQTIEGHEIDATPFFPRMPEGTPLTAIGRFMDNPHIAGDAQRLAERQSTLRAEGDGAPGVSRAEFDQAKQDIFGETPGTQRTVIERNGERTVIEGPTPSSRRAAETAPETAEAPLGPTASVPFMITAAMRRDLGAAGFTPEQIRNMTPQRAHEILASAGSRQPSPRETAESEIGAFVDRLRGAAGETPARAMVPIAGPAYAREAIERSWATANRLGVVDDIERLAAEGRTAADVARELGPRLDRVREIARSNNESERQAAEQFVRNVRSGLGIPSQDQATEFAAWKAAYDARATAPQAAPAAQEGRPAPAKLPIDEVTQGNLDIATNEVLPMIDPALLTPEERAFFTQTGADVDRVAELLRGYDAAAACLGRAGG